MSAPKYPCPVASCGMMLGRGGMVLHLTAKHPEYRLATKSPEVVPEQPRRWTPPRTWPIGATPPEAEVLR